MSAQSVEIQAAETQAGRHDANLIRVLVIDDSVVARASLSRIIESADNLVLSAAVSGAAQAIEHLRSHAVDVMLLDLEMPDWSGLDALPEIMRVGRGAHIIVVSSTARSGAEATLTALALGVADTLLKPTAAEINQSFGAILLDRITRLGGDRTIRRRTHAFSLRRQSVTPIEVLAIGASTGGIRALADFFASLPSDFDAPILLTQHLPSAFIPYFADQVVAMSGRRALVAQGAQTIARNTVIVAPGDAHLIIQRSEGRLCYALSDVPADSRCCPSVDPMLSSVAQACGAGALGVILTGMGRDGAHGAEALVAAGGSVIVQDETTSTVWGMPGAIAKAGLASLVGSPARLADHAASRGSVK